MRGIRTTVVCVAALWLAATGGIAQESRLPLPDAAAREKAARLFREVYKPYPPTDPVARADLAKKLVAEATLNQADPAAYYVVLVEARWLAENTGRIATALAAVDALGRTFAVNAAEAKYDTIVACRQSAFAPDAAAMLQACLELHQAAIAADNYDLALRAAIQAEIASRDINDRDQHVAAMARVRATRQAERDHRLAKIAAEKLRLKPDDPENNLLVGRYLCFVKEAWDRGLPMLAKGSDAALRDLAQQELKRPADAEAKVAMADAWWEYAQKRPADAAAAPLRRAVAWYESALPETSGLKRAYVEKRIADAAPRLGTNVARASGLPQGLAASYYAGKNFDRLVRTCVDAQVNFDWELAAPDPDLPADGFSVRWTGVIVAPRAGQYTLSVTADDGVRLWVDQKLLINQWDAAGKAQTHSIQLNLTGQPQPIRIDYFDDTGAASVRLLWTGPDGAQPVPIPREALSHPQ